MRDGLDAGAYDLSRIGAEVDHHREQGGIVGAEAHPEVREREEHEVELDQERRVADELDVRRRQPPERPWTVDLGHRTRHADGQPEDHRERGQADRQRGPGEEVRKVVHHGAELERVVQWLTYLLAPASTPGIVPEPVDLSLDHTGRRTRNSLLTQLERSPLRMCRRTVSTLFTRMSMTDEGE